MVGAGLTPALLAAFLWKRVTAAGGTASIAAGMLVTTLITWRQDALSGWLSARWGHPVDVTEYMIYPAVLASSRLPRRREPADAAFAARALEAFFSA